MRAIGIDPGLRITGYGCVEADPDRLGTPTLIEGGVIRLVRSRSAEPPPLSERLAELEHDLDEILGRLSPDVVAVEGLFAHYRHPATAIMMAHARGVILLLVQRRSLPLVELKPAQVKMATAGTGRATKRQMQEAVAGIFGLEQAPEPADVADAIGIALAGVRRADLARAAGD